jgi:hypothetical protein
VPAYRSSGDNWRGAWLGNITHGPGALGTAWVAGGSGQFRGMDTEAVEALSAKAYSVADGPVGVTGEISIELQYGGRQTNQASEGQQALQDQ